jgi:FtsP/CotA-like multicopper oxidase with cupredoxin domain
VTSSHAPVRVTIGSPATGRRQPFEVGTELLELATDRVVEVVSHRAAPEAAPPVPGRWCSHCHLLDLCEEGMAQVGHVADR